MGLQLEPFKEEIVGLVPTYGPEGNVTVIYLRSGERVVPQGIKSVQAALFRCYAIDIKAQREQLRGKLIRHGNLPFYLDAQRVFVPVKTRRARASKDAVHGFFDVDCLEEVEVTGEGECSLLLKDGRRIQVFCNRATLERVQALGRRLLRNLQGARGERAGSEVVIEAARHCYGTLESISTTLIKIERLINTGRRYRVKK